MPTFSGPFDRQLKILICEDDDGVRESYKLILEGHDLTFVSIGKDAIEQARRHPFDLLFVDINMPHLNGIQVLESLRKVKPRLPIIMATGYQSQEIATEAARHGAADYLIKPFASKEVYAAIQMALQRYAPTKK